MMVKDLKNIYPNLKRLSKQRGITISAIEKAAGFQPGYFSRRKETGICNSTVLVTAANMLGVSVDDLLEEPPVYSNADKFQEVFGLNPKVELPNDDFWYLPYKG